MGAAARLVHDVAHQHAGGRWLATGGGGYDVYRVVPRAWSLVWLAAAHRDVPELTPEAWRERWAEEAARYGQAPLPPTFDDPPTPTDPATTRSIERQCCRCSARPGRAADRPSRELLSPELHSPRWPIQQPRPARPCVCPDNGRTGPRRARVAHCGERVCG